MHTSSPGPMRPQFLLNIGEPPIKWMVWIMMFHDYLIEYNLDLLEARKLALLRSSLGAEGYRISTEFSEEQDITYDTVIKRLSNRFVTRASVILYRIQFLEEFSSHLKI